MKPTLLTKRIPTLSLAEIAALLNEAGFPAVNLCVRDGHPVNPDNVETELVNAAKIFVDESISFPMITTRGDFVDPEEPGVERTLAACAEASVQLAKIGYWIVEDDYRRLFDRARKALASFARLAEKHGVRVVVHTHSGDFLTNTAAAALALISDLDPRFVGIYADVGHLHLNGEPAKMALDMVKDYLAVVGMQDSIWTRVGDEWQRSIVPLGEGMVDWKDLKGLLTNMDFRGPLAFHTDHYPTLEIPFKDHAREELEHWNSV